MYFENRYTLKYTIPTTTLPVQEIVTQVVSHFKKNTTLIVKAPPGAGKSTLLPLTFLNEPWLADKKIIVLEPRRLAAKTIATRLSQLLNEEVGNTVGYRIRFETRVSDATRIEVVTEGILTRMLQTDNTLKDVALVIFDEFHERSIHADVALALCREAQLTKRTDLRLLIMSATMDLPELSSKLGCKIIESEGRQYPVAVHYTGATDMHLLPELTARVIKKASKDNKGDILVFLPGQGEILACKELLEDKLKDTVIHTLYGQLPFAQQQAALLPDETGKRKVVLATSIAETSLTIQGVTTVVDSGFGKRSKFDPESGLSRLETINISMDAADQRAGRAGRLSPGTCYRMWTEAQHENLERHHQPEIETTDLSSLVLEMAIWGITNVFNMVWLTPPPKSNVKQARETLHYINALDRNKVTPHGKKIHQLPCNPRIAHMLLMAEELEQEVLATDLAATLEEKDPLNAKEAGIDINERIKALRRFRTNNGKGKAFGLIERVAKSYRELMEIEVDNEKFDPYMTGLLLAYAYPERIAFARPGNQAQFQLANGTYAEFSHKDSLSRESWLSVGRIDNREGTGKIFSALPLNPKDLKGLVKTVLSAQWDLMTNDLIVHTELRIGHIVLKSSPMDDPSDEERARALCDVVRKDGRNLLNFTPEFKAWQAAIFDAQQKNPLSRFPEVDTDSLLLSCAEWLAPLADDIEEKEDLKDLDLLKIISARIPKELLELV